MKYVFAERLAALRTQTGLSQKELAAVIKATPSSLSNYENGIYLPPLDKACKLADALHASLDYLTGLSDKNIDPALFARSITEKLSFYQIIKLLSALDSRDILEIVRYMEYLKYRKKHNTYVDSSKPLQVAEE